MFSVIIPLYNKEREIGRTISTVLKQTFKNFELLIVDDGSTDSSLDIAKSFSDSRIRVVSKKNGGVADARNCGIELAEAEYIAFLDADDEWEPNFLFEIDRLISKFPASGIFTSAYKIIKPGKTIVQGKGLQEGVIENFFQIKNDHLIPWTSATVVKKIVFRQVGGFPKGMIAGEDEYMWCKAAMRFPVAFTPAVLAKYNKISSTSANRRGKVDTCKESWFDFYDVKASIHQKEFIYKKAIYTGIRYAYSSEREKSRNIEAVTQDTRLHKKKWKTLFRLNRLPVSVLLLLKTLLPLIKKGRHQLAKIKSQLNYSFNAKSQKSR